MASKDLLIYDGQWLYWTSPGDGSLAEKYKATSGLLTMSGADYRHKSQQCTPEAGPIPEGNYAFQLKIDPRKYAADDGTGICKLKPSRLIQGIPRGTQAGACEPWWSNWGRNRVRLEASDAKTRSACRPARGGFYLHDSTKGFSHGCIEVEERFFDRLIKYARKASGRSIDLRVKYGYDKTDGGTKKP